MADTRIDKLATLCTGSDGTHLTDPISAEDEAEHLLADIEAAGLVVIDPDDESTAKLVRQAICDPGFFLPRGENYTEPLWEWQARAVCAVLQAAE